MPLGSKHRFSRSFTSRFASRLVGLAAVGASLLATSVASAASLEGAIQGWQKGSEPSWVSMYQYIPDNVQPGAPILVIVHYCSGNAQGIFGQATSGGMVSFADQNGVIILVPQTSQNCWDVATTPSLTHGGGGDTLAIVHQVEYIVAQHDANADRVYVTGTSSGGMVTQALLAVYPDVFKGGAEFAGVPAGCWSVNNPNGQWSSPCAGGMVTHTAEEWGNMARNMYPGYTGFRPRIQLWHGSADSTISYTNHTEAIKQWTNVLGLPAAATTVTNVTIGAGQYERSEWKDACGITVLDSWSQPNGPHGTGANMNSEQTMPFFALDQPGPTDPQAAGCAAGGTGGMGGDGGTAGDTGMAGSAMGGAGMAGTTGIGGDGTAGMIGVGGDGTAGASVGGTTGGSVASGGTTGGTTGGTGGAPEIPERPGCACSVVGAPNGAGALAWAGLLFAMFGRRRAKRSTTR